MTALNPLPCLPAWMSWWLGYRSAPSKQPPEYVIYIWSFIGAFCGLSILQAFFGRLAYFAEQGVPPIIVSYVRGRPFRISRRRRTTMMLNHWNLHREPRPYLAMELSKHPLRNPVPSSVVTSSVPSLASASPSCLASFLRRNV